MRWSGESQYYFGWLRTCSVAAACSFCWCFLIRSGGPHTLLETPKAPALALACCVDRSPTPRSPDWDAICPGLHNSTGCSCRHPEPACGGLLEFTDRHREDRKKGQQVHLAALCLSIAEGPGSCELLAGWEPLLSRLSSRSSMRVLALGWACLAAPPPCAVVVTVFSALNSRPCLWGSPVQTQSLLIDSTMI